MLDGYQLSDKNAKKGKITEMVFPYDNREIQVGKSC